MSRILVIEDDPMVRDVVELALCRDGAQTVGVGSGEEALERLRDDGAFDLVILDIMLPGEKDGFSVCRELREGTAGKANKDVPVIMLTARDDERSITAGLEGGADDYITKPFRPRELVSRVRAHLRRRRRALRAGGQHQSKLEFPDFTIDFFDRKVISKGETLSLTPRQYKVLALLASSPGQVFSRRQIMEHLREEDFCGKARSADTHIHNLRQKVEPDPKNPRYLLSVRGFGYRLADPS